MIQVSENGLYCDAECDDEILDESSSNPGERPILHTCVPLNVVQPLRKRKSETEFISLPCKKINPEEKTNTISGLSKKLDDKGKHGRFLIPTRDKPPPELNDWLIQFQVNMNVYYISK